MTVEFRKVGTSFFLIWLPCLQHMIVDDRGAVTQGDRCSFVASSGGNAMILGSEIRIFRSRGGVGRLDQDRFGIPIPFANASTPLFAATLVIAWADANQRGEVRR